MYTLDDIEVLTRHRHTVELQLGRGIDTKVRDFNFATDHEGTSEFRIHGCCLGALVSYIIQLN